MYDESFPIARVRIKYRNRLPWLSAGLESSLKLQTKLYMISFKHPTMFNVHKYKQYKNKLISILKFVDKISINTKLQLQKQFKENLGNH